METITLDINSDCNLKCGFCYRQNSDKQISLQDLAVITRKFQEAKNFQIGGGEPLLHPDCMEILDFLLKNGKKVHLSTNGTIKKEDLLNYKGENIGFQVSLHAGNRETFREVTGEDLFERAVANLSFFKEISDTIISSVIYQTNYQECGAILDIASNYELPIRITLPSIIGKGKNIRVLDAQKIKDLTNFLICEKEKRNIPILSPLLEDNVSCMYFFTHYALGSNTCVECKDRAYISPDLKITKCEFVK